MRIIIDKCIAICTIHVIKIYWCKYIEGDIDNFDLRKEDRVANASIREFPTFTLL